MPLEHKPEKAVAQKGARNVTAHTYGNNTNITVIACGSAAGQGLPSMVLLEGKKTKPCLYYWRGTRYHVWYGEWLGGH